MEHNPAECDFLQQENLQQQQKRLQLIRPMRQKSMMYGTIAKLSGAFDISLDLGNVGIMEN